MTAGDHPVELIADAAIAAVLRDDHRQAALLARRIGAEHGPIGMIRAVTHWCHRHIEHATGGRPSTVHVVQPMDRGTGRMNPPDTPPEVHWAARLVTAFAHRDVTAFNVCLHELGGMTAQARAAHLGLILTSAADSIRSLPYGYAAVLREQR